MTGTERQMQEIHRKLIISQIVDSLGFVLLGLGLYTKFGPGDQPLIPLLGDEQIVWLMLLAGFSMVLWGSFNTVALLKEKTAIKKRYEY